MCSEFILKNEVSKVEYSNVLLELKADLLGLDEDLVSDTTGVSFLISLPGEIFDAKDNR